MDRTLIAAGVSLWALCLVAGCNQKSSPATGTARGVLAQIRAEREQSESSLAGQTAAVAESPDYDPPATVVERRYDSRPMGPVANEPEPTQARLPVGETQFDSPDGMSAYAPPAGAEPQGDAALRFAMPDAISTQILESAHGPRQGRPRSVRVEPADRGLKQAAKPSREPRVALQPKQEVTAASKPLIAEPVKTAPAEKPAADKIVLRIEPETAPEPQVAAGATPPAGVAVEAVQEPTPVPAEPTLAQRPEVRGPEPSLVAPVEPAVRPRPTLAEVAPEVEAPLEPIAAPVVPEAEPQVAAVEPQHDEPAEELKPEPASRVAQDDSAVRFAKPTPMPAADPLPAPAKQAEAAPSIAATPAAPPVTAPQVPQVAQSRPATPPAPLKIEPAQPVEVAPQPKPAAPREQLAGPPRKLEPVPTEKSQPATEQTPLPWANAPERTPEMDAVTRRAMERVTHAFQLAERNAVFSARAEFISALELIAQANDVQQGTQFYSRSLAAGLMALKESSDFVRPATGGRELDVQRLVRTHRSRVLKSDDIDGMTALAAVQRYYTFAQEQLAGAGAQEPAASAALYGLGKVSMVTADGNPSRRLESTAQAMTLFQASLMTDPRNFRAANELGVILARNGDYVRARELLTHSVKLTAQPVSCQNLAAVLNKLGEPQLAAQSRAQAQALVQKGVRAGGPNVQWVDPATFASTAPSSDVALPPVAKPDAQAPAAAPAKESQEPAARTATKKSLGDYLPWNQKR